MREPEWWFLSEYFYFYLVKKKMGEKPLYNPRIPKKNTGNWKTLIYRYFYDLVW